MLNIYNVPILILARGGSKRIPNKNIIDFCGRPLISYTIEESLKVSENVYVSTENKKIAEISKQYGAKIINRPKELAQDNTTSEESAKHFLKEINYDGIFVLVQATSPLIKSEYIKQGIEKYTFSCLDSMFSIEKNEGVYYDNKTCYFGKMVRERQNGAFFITKAWRILMGYSFTSGIYSMIEMPKKHSIDIDTFEDLEIAEYIYKGEKEKGLR